MGSKAILFLGLFLAIFLMISSEVVARELVETSPAVKLDNENEVDGHGHYGGGGGGGYHKRGGHKPCYHKCRRYHCCSYEEYVAMGGH